MVSPYSNGNVNSDTARQLLYTCWRCGYSCIFRVFYPPSICAQELKEARGRASEEVLGGVSYRVHVITVPCHTSAQITRAHVLRGLDCSSSLSFGLLPKFPFCLPPGYPASLLQMGRQDSQELVLFSKFQVIN